MVHELKLVPLWLLCQSRGRELVLLLQSQTLRRNRSAANTSTSHGDVLQIYPFAIILRPPPPLLVSALCAHKHTHTHACTHKHTDVGQGLGQRPIGPVSKALHLGVGWLDPHSWHHRLGGCWCILSSHRLPHSPCTHTYIRTYE